MPDSIIRALPLTTSHTTDGIPSELYGAPRWYACRTRARAEKRVHSQLRGRGIESYLPLVQQVRQWSDRKKRVAFPLFAGYVFARFTLRQVHEILRTPGVATILRVNGYPAPVRDDELESVRILVAAVNAGEVPPEPAEYLEVGQEVLVVEGPFCGMRGVLLDVRGRARVAVRISALRQAVSVELSRELLRAAEDGSRRP